MIDAQKQRVGFFAENSRWIRPLIAALILLAVPIIADQFGGFKIPTVVTSSMAIVALVFAAIMARMTATLAAKVFMWIIMAAGVIALGVKLAQFI